MKKKICHLAQITANYHAIYGCFSSMVGQLGAAKSASIGLNHKDSINIKIRRV